MQGKPTVFVIAAMLCIGSQSGAFYGETVSTGTAQSGSGGGKTVWDGVYTAAQATRGKAQYEANCTSCHGKIMGGDKAQVLKGNEFMQNWREDNLESLFSFLKSSMPPIRSRSKDYVLLPDNVYLDIMVYILQANEFPAGPQDLRLDALKNIQVQEKDGPKPLATSTLVQVVGCMTMTEEPDGIVWVLTRASEPRRTRNSDVTTPDELKAAGTNTLGTLSFRLQNLGYLGATFNPNLHEGHKMQAKGTLIRQSNRLRLDVTSLDMVGSSCTN